MINITVAGNLGADATYVEGANGKPGRMNFNVAATSGYGENQKTIWFSCTKWGGAGGVLQYLKKGTKVVVAGRLGTYEDKEGGTRLNVDVFEVNLVNNVERVAPGESGKSRSEQRRVAAQKGDEPPAFDDEIPF